MSNFELIDDYLTGRLQGEDKVTFEGQMASDPALKSEVELQKSIVQAIKKSRAAELKHMLNQVPISTSAPVDFSVLRMAAGLAGAGVLAASLYLYFKPEIHLEDASTDILKKTEQLKPSTEETTPTTIDSSSSTMPETKPADGIDAAKETKPAARKVKRSEVQKPAIDVVDPTDELNPSNDPSHPNDNGQRASGVRASQVEIEVDSSNKKYDFHYQFESKKLMLYGSFDKTLYEVIEINGVDHSLFLFYKDQFYLLDEMVHVVTKLSPIKDAALVSKLKAYRK